MELNKQETVKSIEEKNQILFKLKEDLKKFINLNSQRYATLDEQLKTFISFGNNLTGFSIGIISKIKGQEYKIIQTVCEEDVLNEGDVFDLKDTICRVIVKQKESHIYDKIKGSDVENISSVVSLGLNSYIGCPITVNNEIYGTLNFSKKSEIKDLEAFQYHFFIIEIMAQVVGVLIAQHQQNEKVKELNLSLQNVIQNLELKNKQLEEFTYIAAHDLQEPLKNVKNMVHLICKKTQNEDVIVQQSLHYLTAAAERMSTLILGLMVYAKIGSSKELITLDCNDIIKQILEDFQLQIKESNAIINSEKLPVIKGYELETRLLFQNLISNAIKYRKHNVNPEITITYTEEKEHYLFKVIDNGKGIKKENHERIFKIFQRGQIEKEKDSTGIGLAHCFKIVELYKGKIWLDSVLGEGTTFFIQLGKL